MARALLLLLFLLVQVGVARGEVANRSYKSLGDVVYVPSEGRQSCGKAARDLLKNATKGAKVIKLTTRTLQVNNGEPQGVVDRSGTSVVAMKSHKDPVPDFPDRVVTMGMMLMKTSEDDYSLAFMRLVESQAGTCSDSYVVSVE